jgi:hypothetical protein
MLTMTSFSAVLFLASFAAIGIAVEKWEDFRVTFSSVPILGQGLHQINRLQSEAIAQGWVPISNDCANGGKFNGFRFVYEEDNVKQYDRVLLFDKQGTIAGIQMLLPQSAVLSVKSTIQLDKTTMYQNDTLNNVDYFVLTSYFQNPDTICTVGRSAEQLESEGTGNGLWFQNGISPASLIQAPLERGAAITEGWSKNACFFQMGVHNFYQLDTFDATNCNQMRPAFLLFNLNDQLIGFGYVSPGKVASKYFENPSYLAIRAIANPGTPLCLEQVANDGISSMHVYFRNNTNQFTCPKA